MPWAGVGFPADVSVTEGEIGDRVNLWPGKRQLLPGPQGPAFKPDSCSWGWNVLSQHVREPKRIEDKTLHHLIRRCTEPIECSMA
jgi:hypothetical protein